MNTCFTCKIEKDLDKFPKDKQTKSGYRGQCKACRSEAHKKRCPIKLKAYKTQYYQENKEKLKCANLKWNYGISLEEYNKMFALQDGKCLGCNTHQVDLKKVLAVDHCHNTGKVRGLLCMGCNLALGHVKDDTQTLTNLINYLGGTPSLL